MLPKPDLGDHQGNGLFVTKVMASSYQFLWQESPA